MNLKADALVFAYRSDRPVLRGVTLDVVPGRVTALFGLNGCGKSTLLRCLNGALRPQAGRVLLDGRPVNSMTPREVACHVAVVPQDTPTDVPFTATEMVMLGRYARSGAWGEQSVQDHTVVRQCLERVEAADLADRWFSELSGGERQRVIIARALAQQGRILLLDEPASHLDIAHQLELYRQVRRLAGEGQAVLMVCHDLFLAPLYVDTAILMTAGRILAAGTPREVLTPAHLETAFGIRAEAAWKPDGTVQMQLPSSPDRAHGGE
ncbi:MAG: ABC transporter ATP-binding protein [Planctomycetes bacterium]|nr:ABC transporter ATP-binding protein [Planctomycetota bacterium]